MSCNCQHRAAESPEQIVSKVKKGTVKFCDVCDPCNECVTNVKICAFVVPTLEEGRYFKNSFIFVQEDDSVYFISDDRSEIPFGSRPKFIDDFDPTDAAVHFKSTVVYDVKNNAGYVYDPQGNMTTIAMSSAPFSSLTGGEGIIVTATGGDYTVAIDPATVASAEDLHTVTLLVTNHTGQINALQDAQDTMAGDIETIEDDLDHTHDLVDDANELAVEAKENAAAAQQTANEALSGLNNKQDRLAAGDNISILNNEISATDTTYTAGTGLSLNGTQFSADTTVLATQNDLSSKQNTLTAGSNITISGDTISATDTTYSAFTGTDGTSAGTAGLVPAPAAADAGYFLSASGDWEEIPAGGGGVIELTAADYDYPTTGTADGVAAWLLDPGVYAAAVGVKVYTNTTTSSNDGQTLIVSETTRNRIKPIVRIYESGTYSNVQIYGTIPTSGQGSGGDLLAYRNIKQSAGNSTTNVMSQDATTSMVYADPSTRQKVQIGAGSSAGGNASVATGMGAAASYDGSIALGAYARTSATGEMNIGTSLTVYGYNSSNYRLLTGLYDPQSAHDAATKGYVDGLVGNIAAALNAINNGGGN